MTLRFPNACKDLTPAEERLLEFIEREPDEFLFLTIGQLAQRLSVSEATISRFARHLGLQSFRELKSEVMRQRHPARRAHNDATGGSGSPLTEGLARAQEEIARVASRLDAAAFQATVEELLSATTVYLHAHGEARCASELLFVRLRRLGLQVELLPGGGPDLTEALHRMAPNDLAVLFTASQPTNGESRILAACSHTVCIGSGRHAPSGQEGYVGLQVDRQDGTVSMVALVAVVEALAQAIAAQGQSDPRTLD